jgi:hypothetical protein
VAFSPSSFTDGTIKINHRSLKRLTVGLLFKVAISTADNI